MTKIMRINNMCESAVINKWNTDGIWNTIRTTIIWHIWLNSTGCWEFQFKITGKIIVIPVTVIEISREPKRDTVSVTLISNPNITLSFLFYCYKPKA